MLNRRSIPLRVKKYILGLCIFLLLIATPSSTSAADNLARMFSASKQDQDAMIVGQIIDKQGAQFKVKVLKVLSGEVSSEYILVSDEFNYGWDKGTPSVSDFGVFSLKKSLTSYKKALGIFQATGGDYKTLELKSLNAPTTGSLGDLAAIKWYVNTAGKDKDFFFNRDTAYVRRQNGQVIQIYPVPIASEEAKIYKNTLNQIRNSPTVSDNVPVTSLWHVLFVIAAVIIGIGGSMLFIKSRKQKV
jgi:hypothetical protein